MPDLTAFKHLNPSLPQGSLFADKAYADTETEINLQVKEVQLLTPYKRKRNESIVQTKRLWSHFVSPAVKQRWKVSGAFRTPITKYIISKIVVL